MAKAAKMNRGVSAKPNHNQGGGEAVLPAAVHSWDGHGNIFASLPELSRVSPKYFTLDEIRAACLGGKCSSLSEDDVRQLETLISRR
jgi:hypothetical protein